MADSLISTSVPADSPIPAAATGVNWTLNRLYGCNARSSAIEKHGVKRLPAVK